MHNPPDAIVPLSGGTVQDPSGEWRSTTYQESDSFGTLGGYVKMQAGAILAKRYPNAFIVANSKCMDGRLPSHAQVHARELVRLGVEEERVILEEKSITTKSEVIEALKLAGEMGWKNIFFVSNEYHLPRVRAFYEQTKSSIAANFISAEAVLIEKDPVFRVTFEEIKKTPAYQLRLASEMSGVEAIRRGEYKGAPLEEKKERKI